MIFGTWYKAYNKFQCLSSIWQSMRSNSKAQPVSGNIFQRKGKFLALTFMNSVMIQGIVLTYTWKCTQVKIQKLPLARWQQYIPLLYIWLLKLNVKDRKFLCTFFSSVTHTSYWPRDHKNKWMQDSAMQPKGHATWPPNEKTETEKIWHSNKDKGTVNSVVWKNKREDYMTKVDKPPSKESFVTKRKMS